MPDCLGKVVTGGIKSDFYKNCHDYNFPEDSPYNAAREALEPTMAGRSAATYSETTTFSPHLPDLTLTSLRPAPPEVYAKTVVRNSLSWWPSLWLWTGSETTTVWLLTTFLWHTALVSAHQHHDPNVSTLVLIRCRILYLPGCLALPRLLHY